MNNLSINGRTSFNFSYDGVTNKDTGQNGANYAAPALDSIAEIRVQTSNFQAEYGRSSGATITVVTRSGTQGLSRQRGLLQARRRVERQRVPASHPVRPGSDGAVRPAALHVRQRRVDARRAGADPEDRASTGAATSCSSSGRRTSWGAPIPGNLNQRRVPTALERQGDFSQTLDNQNRLIFIRDPLLAGQLRRDQRRAGVLPQQRDPGQPDRSQRARAAESVPAAERDRSDRDEPVQLRVPDRAGLAAQRSGAARRLERRAEHDGVRTAAVRLREALRRRLAARLDRRLAADGDEVRDRHRQLREHAAAHVQPDAVRRVHRRRELGASVHEPVRRGRARRQRSPRRAAGHAAVLPAGESARHPSASHVHRRRARNDRCSSASSSGSRSSATTRCSTSPATSRRSTARTR